MLKSGTVPEDPGQLAPMAVPTTSRLMAAMHRMRPGSGLPAGARAPRYSRLGTPLDIWQAAGCMSMQPINSAP